MSHMQITGRERPRSAPGQYLTFMLAGEEYAIAILRVREILECPAVTRVPGTPVFVRGVVNLRGTVLPVIDLAAKLGLGDTAITKWTCVVIVQAESEGATIALGLMTDAMSRLMDLGPEEIEPVPAIGTAVRLEYLLGMCRPGAGFAPILDIDRILSPEELSAVAAVDEPAPARGLATPAEDPKDAKRR